MKIALITTGKLPQPAISGGIETLIDFIIEENENYNNELVCYSIKPEIIQPNKMINVKFIYFKTNKLYDKIIKKINVITNKLGFILPNSFSLQVLKSMKKTEFELCLIENNINILCNVQKINCKNIIYHIHYNDFNDSLDPFTKKIYKRSFAKCRTIIAISEYIKKVSERVLDLNNIKIVKNIIDYDIFQLVKKDEILKIKNKYEIADEDFIIFYSGRIVKEKGVLELIEAFNLAYKKNRRIKLMIVGDVQNNNELQSSYCEKIKDKSKMNSNIILTGYVDNKKLNNYVAISDLTIIPTLHVEEAAGLVCLESMCLKKPIIITDSGALGEYTNGLAIKIKRDDNFIINLAKEIIKLSEDNNQLNKIGENLYNSLAKCDKDMYYKKIILDNIQKDSDIHI
ncbi:glycosyltransferase family 4 protein [[Clostridium] innocuum]|nr:glycosyltransferase family 4 protein [[Clostridium] innocuum]